MSKEEQYDVKDALNEFFKLKSKFESDLAVLKKKIINNVTLSNREKRAEYLRIKPKCVNCKRPSKKGTIFSINFVPESEKTSAYKKFKAICGDLAEPCNLNIEINIGDSEPLDKLMRNIQDEITENKNKIINDKNKLLFGLITTENALENFDFHKSYISELTTVYESYLDQWNKIVDNPSKKQELDETLVTCYENIATIKEYIKKMQEEDDTQYALDAVNIYITTLQPLLDKVRKLKYSEDIVYHDDADNTCKLIQKKYTFADINVSAFTDTVVSFNVGLQAQKSIKKGFIIEEEEEESVPVISEKELTIKIQEEPDTDSEVIFGEGQDGIQWKNPEYNKLWDRLPVKLKAELKLNVPWMKQFMSECVKTKLKSGGESCRLTAPPNLVIPPRKTSNGEYDFGVKIYNNVFNKLPKTSQDTYLTLYKENPNTKAKDYTMFIETINSLVEKEVGFGKGFF